MKKKINFVCVNVNYRSVHFKTSFHSDVYQKLTLKCSTVVVNKFSIRIKRYDIGYRFPREQTLPFSLEEQKRDEFELGHLPILINKHLHFRNASPTAKYIPTLQSQICHCLRKDTREENSWSHPYISTPSANHSMAIPW